MYLKKGQEPDYGGTIDRHLPFMLIGTPSRTALRSTSSAPGGGEQTILVKVGIAKASSNMISERQFVASWHSTAFLRYIATIDAGCKDPERHPATSSERDRLWTLRSEGDRATEQLGKREAIFCSLSACLYLLYQHQSLEWTTFSKPSYQAWWCAEFGRRNRIFRSKESTTRSLCQHLMSTSTESTDSKASEI